MPASKPQSLHTSAKTKADRQARQQAEDEVTPKGELPKSVRALHGHKVAQAIWKRLAAEYAGLEATIVTRLDVDMLVDYCLMMEQMVDLDAARKKAVDVVAKPETVEQMLKGLELLNRLDARADRKRALLLQWRQSLYLTPRARAGAVAARKPPEQPVDELERLLNEVDLR